MQRPCGRWNLRVEELRRQPLVGLSRKRERVRGGYGWRSRQELNVFRA